MGTSASKTRSVSVENDGPGIIDISDDVVQRLKSNLSKGKRKFTSLTLPSNEEKKIKISLNCYAI